MESMDFKGIAWVGNIYQKFEAMCLEVEEAMSQETAKYVENQVNTVGASMKKFCSDVMQDLAPPSSKDLSRVASTELSLNPYLEFGIHKVKKPISSLKKVDKDHVHAKVIPQQKLNSSNDVWEDWSAASVNWDLSDNDEEKFERTTVHAASEASACESKGEHDGKILNTIVGTSLASPAPSTTVSIKSIAKIGKSSRCTSASNSIRTKSTDTCKSSRMSLQATSNTSSRQSLDGDVSHTGSNTSSRQSLDGDVSHTESGDNTRHMSPSQIDPYVSSSKQCCQSIGDDAIGPQTESGDNNRHVSPSQIDPYVSSSKQRCQSIGDEVIQQQTGSTEDRDPIVKNENDTTVQMMEPTSHEPESGFEETCVLVDGNDFRPDNHEEEKRRSYKKKIQNVFSLKKKSSRKHEYKQIAAQFNNHSAEPNVQGVETESHALALSEDKKAQKLATNDSLESEWELL